MFYLTPPRHISTLPFSDLGARSCEVRFTSMNGHRQAVCHVRKVPLPDSCTAAECRHSITLWALESYSGNPAFRRPSMNSFALASPPQAINGDIVKAGSSSSTRIAASRASASRPRWAKADARQR